VDVRVNVTVKVKVKVSVSVSVSVDQAEQVELFGCGALAPPKENVSFLTNFRTLAGLKSCFRYL